jgi:hypothetical protein
MAWPSAGQGCARLHLADIDRLNAAAENLAQVGAGIQRERAMAAVVMPMLNSGIQIFMS